jgi:adapter protein MecA 1/2
MKIEKLNENQIRITLTQDDLASRQMRLAELAYGTEKARLLFRDMMQQAAYQYGFNVDNIPLMIEAVPMSEGSIVLIVTKVDNPEELDTRFSNFAPSVQAFPETDAASPMTPFEQLLNVIRSGSAASRDGSGETVSSQAPAQEPSESRDAFMDIRKYLFFNRLYSFDSLADVMNAVQAAPPGGDVASSLYLDEKSGTYYLFISMISLEEVNAMQKTLAVLSEYGRMEKISPAREESLAEHARTIIAGTALQQLGEV